MLDDARQAASDEAAQAIWLVALTGHLARFPRLAAPVR
jgi:hypothetical protein